MPKIEDIEESDLYTGKSCATSMLSPLPNCWKSALPQRVGGPAEKAGIDRKLILEWVNHSDLYRIKGVDRNIPTCLRKPAWTPWWSLPLADLITFMPKSLRSTQPKSSSAVHRAPRWLPTG